MLAIGMGRIETAISDSLTVFGEKGFDIDFDPGKLESHHEAGR